MSWFELAVFQVFKPPGACGLLYGTAQLRGPQNRTQVGFWAPRETSLHQLLLFFVPSHGEGVPVKN